MSNKQKEQRPVQETPIGEVFFAAQVETVIRESRRGVLILLAISLFSAIWFSREWSPRAVYTWFLYMGVVCLAAYFILRKMLADPDKELKARGWVNGLILGSLLIGTGWGAFCALFFPYDNAAQLVFLLLATGAVTALASSVLSPVLSVFWVFLLSAVSPLCVQVFIYFGYSLFHSVLVLAVFLLIMGYIADRNEKQERINVSEKVTLKREVEGRRLLDKALLLQQERADTAVTERREFMSNVSLQMRTQLNSIIGFSDILKKNARGDLSPEHVSRADKINRNGRDMLLVFDNVLELSKIETNQLELEERKVNLHNLVEESVELQRVNTNEKGLNLSSEIADNVPELVITDPTRLWQILNNLIGNAVKFTKKGGIEVNVDSGGPTNGSTGLKFSVTDTGIGIDEKTRAELFLPFSHRESGPDEGDGGMSLGLAVSKNLVELMGGEITVWSEPGKGSVFDFTIQCGQVPQGADTASEDLA